MVKQNKTTTFQVRHALYLEQYNTHLKTKTKNIIKKIQTTLHIGSPAEAQALLEGLIKHIDSLKHKNIYHRNKIARIKRNLHQKVKC
jgi:ribosomal protein S20